MKILDFSCEGLNGYINFDRLTFHTGLSFLIGINGSGKTSVIRAVMALLTPEIDYLYNGGFRKISVTILSDGRQHVISAERADEGKLLRYQSLGINTRFSLTPQVYRLMQRDVEEFEFDEEDEPFQLVETHTEPPEDGDFFERLRTLPTPIYLGLDRTTIISEVQRSRALRRQRRPRRSHPTVRAFLDESVAQAEALAIDARQRAERARASRASKLREDILLTIFDETNATATPSQLPRAADVRKYESSRRSLKTAFEYLGIPSARTSAAIDPFYTRVIESASKLSKLKPDEIIGVQSPSRDLFFEWVASIPRLALIGHVEELVRVFNEDTRAVFEKLSRYSDILNSFFVDSKKRLYFDERGELVLDLPSGVPADVYFMSSGERQLFVLITALMFNTEAAQANVLIIDEPELSLHVRWQENFVGSLLQASPEVQLILATHSPSIILDRDNACIDLV